MPISSLPSCGTPEPNKILELFFSQETIGNIFLSKCIMGNRTRANRSRANRTRANRSRANRSRANRRKKNTKAKRRKYGGGRNTKAKRRKYGGRPTALRPAEELPAEEKAKAAELAFSEGQDAANKGLTRRAITLFKKAAREVDGIVDLKQLHEKYTKIAQETLFKAVKSKIDKGDPTDPALVKVIKSYNGPPDEWGWHKNNNYILIRVGTVLRVTEMNNTNWWTGFPHFEVELEPEDIGIFPGQPNYVALLRD
jgi:hypothetical protein